MSEKIRPHHLERKAILYVRQSSVYQVNNNLESQKLQYAMEKDCAIWVGGKSRLWTKIWAGPPRERWQGPGSSGW